MRPAAQHIRLVTGVFILTFLTRAAGSSFPFLFPLQTQTNPPGSREIDSEAARSFAQLNSPDEEKRRDAVMKLSRVEGNAATSALLSALPDSSPRVRAAAAAGIAERGEVSAVSLLAACLVKDKDAFVRKTTAYALGAFRGIDRTSALIAALKDKDPEVRGAAAVSLGDHAEPDAVAPLMTALSDKNAFVRAQAARALGVNGAAAKQSVPTLKMLLTSDEDGEVKRQAAAALGSIGDRSALRALERAAREGDPYLAQAALDAIKTISQ
jgi:HEAT repeat protein